MIISKILPPFVMIKALSCLFKSAEYITEKPDIHAHEHTQECIAITKTYQSSITHIRVSTHKLKHHRKSISYAQNIMCANHGYVCVHIQYACSSVEGLS